MLFKMIQVAGPRLTPANVSNGMHAIPAIASSSPYVASCYFDPGDYSCIKDSMEESWSESQTSPQDTTPGCWVMAGGGTRFLAHASPTSDDLFNPADPCNGYGPLDARS
jgi:hypothetical protein